MAYAEKRGTGKHPWRARYKLPDGTLGSEPGFRTKKQAQEWGEDQEAAIRHGRWTDPRHARTPFGEWADEWMDAQHVAPATATKRRQLLATHLLPEWEHTPICEINLFSAKAWAARQTCAQVTVRHALTLLSMILTGAADKGYLIANPMYGRRRTTGRTSHDTTRHRVEEAEEVWAQPEDVFRIYRRLGGVAGLMVVTAAFTGLRWGELAGLHRDNALLAREDQLGGRPFLRRVLRIDPLVGSLHEVGGLYLGPPKNKSSAREVDLPPFLAALWQQHLDGWEHEFVFATPAGKWWRRGNFARRELRPAADGREAVERRRGTAGREKWEPILPGLTMRGLRHTHSTWMKDDLVDRALRFETMGWTVKDIEGVYEHVTPQMRKIRLDGLEKRWRAARRAGLRVAG